MIELYLVTCMLSRKTEKADSLPQRPNQKPPLGVSRRNDPESRQACCTRGTVTTRDTRFKA